MFSKAHTLYSNSEFRRNEANKTIDYSNRKIENECNVKKAYQEYCKYKTYKSYIPSRNLSSNGIKAKKEYIVNISRKNCKSSNNNYISYQNVNSKIRKANINDNLIHYNNSKKSSIRIEGYNNSELYELVDILQQMNIDFEAKVSKAENENREKAEEAKLENHPKVKELGEKIKAIKDQYAKENSNYNNLVYINNDIKSELNQFFFERDELLENNKRLNQKNQIQIKLVLFIQLEEALTKRKLDYEKLEKKYHELKDYRKENDDKDNKNYDDLFVGDTIK